MKFLFFCTKTGKFVKSATYKKNNSPFELLMCKNRHDMVGEYSLRDIEKSIDVSGNKLFKDLPKEYENVFLFAEHIEKRIGAIFYDYD